MDSIIQVEKECYFCGTTQNLECHHIFGGPDRKNSEAFGLKIWLCHKHHNEPPYGVHFNKELREITQIVAKTKFQERWPDRDWLFYFRKEYVTE